jgi:hypothetical protein
MATLLLPVLGTGALLAAGTASRGGVSRVLGLRPAAWIGDLSYSWYLWHWPLIVFATALWPGAGWAAPALAALSLLPAWLSYRYVENPIRLNRRIAGRWVLGLAAICIAVPMGACLGLAATAKLVRQQAATAMGSYDRSRVRHLDFRLGCYSAPPGIRTSGPCTLRVPERRGRLVLIGDSNAGQFTEPVVRAGNRAGFDVTIKVISSCPFVDLSVIYAERQPGFSDPRREMESCRHFYVRTLDALVRLRPNLVVTSARADAYIGRAVIGLGRPSGDITHLAQAKGQLYSQGLASTLRRLNDAGVPVVIVHPVPVVQSDFAADHQCAFWDAQ